jgi:Ca-activated chloride channel family protein
MLKRPIVAFLLSSLLASPLAGCQGAKKSEEAAKGRELGGVVATDKGSGGQAAGSAAYATPTMKVAVGDPTARGEGYADYGTNAWTEAAKDHQSTFAADVDTASYSIARRKLNEGSLPPAAAVRVEEFVNYFRYRYGAPAAGEAFAVHMDAAPSPFNSGRHVLRVGVSTKAKSVSERKKMNLVFLVDVSGSMQSVDKLELAKRSLRILLDNLKDGDTVALVTYAGSTRVVLPATGLEHKGQILAALDDLRAGGSTGMASGIDLAYQEATKGLAPDAESRVIILSDGDANVGPTSHQGLLDLVAGKVKEGVMLSTIGFGMGNYQDATMEQLANKGNGNYAYVDDRAEARRVFVDHLTGTLQVIAKDVKLQVELDPAAVARYRLLGYENRELQRSELDDDRKDAGELGAGHTVTALYEVKLVPYKNPRSETSTEIERDLPMTLVRSAWSDAAPPTQLSVVAAAYAEKLRGSYWVRNLAWADVQRLYAEIDADLRADPDVAELGRLIDRAASLDRRGDRFERDLPLAKMDFDHVPVLR